MGKMACGGVLSIVKDFLKKLPNGNDHMAEFS
jgi:hypothetical protein